MGLNFFQECHLHYWLDKIFDYINYLFRSPDMYDEIKIALVTQISRKIWKTN